MTLTTTSPSPHDPATRRTLETSWRTSGVLKAVAVVAIGLLATISIVFMPALAHAGGSYPNDDAVCIHAGPCTDYNWGYQQTNGTWITNSARGFGYRNCTDFAAFKAGVTWSSFQFPVGVGNAKDWRGYAGKAGLIVNDFPSSRDIAWWDAGSQGIGSFGHVAIVTLVNSDGSANVEEYNRGGDGMYGTRNNVRADKYLHRATPVTAVGKNADGRLEAFYVGGDNGIWHRWQTSPGGSWSAESRIGGNVRSIAVASNADGRLEIFYVGADRAVWHRWQTTPGGTLSGESSLGGGALSIAVTRNADGRLEVFTVGGDNAIWHRWQNAPNAGWSTEERLGGGAKSVAAGSNADGRLEIFFVGGDNAVWHRWQNAPGAGWSGEYSFGGLAKAIAVGRNADGSQEIFTVGGDNAIWHRWQNAPNSGWSGESSIGGVAKDVSVSSNQDGRQEIFTVGGDNNLWHRWQTAPNAGWSAESWLGGWVKI